MADMAVIVSTLKAFLTFESAMDSRGLVQVELWSGLYTDRFVWLRYPHLARICRRQLPLMGLIVLSIVLSKAGGSVHFLVIMVVVIMVVRALISLRRSRLVA